MAYDHLLIYMTAGTEEEASRIADALVGERIAACVNIIPGMRSVYEWQGEVHRDAEVVLIAKTVAARLVALRERVTELHSYDCPCIVALPVDGGNPAFLDWISQQVIA